MAEARNRAEWGRTAALLAQTANVHRDRKKRPNPFTPDDFNPHAGQRRRHRGLPVSVAQLTDDIMRPIERPPVRARRPPPSPPGVPPPAR